MAENDTPKTNAPTTKPAAKTKKVAGTVVLTTRTFDPTQPLLLDQAADAFKAQVAETHGAVSNVTVTLAQHKVGESVTYNVEGETAG